MRGKRGVEIHQVKGVRNIPAYAGKTIQRSHVGNPAPEHPRVCGENLSPVICRRLFGGTSPRMRGKQSCRPHGAPPDRNIPAYAGKTAGLIANRIGGAEHPRVCGENEGFAVVAVFECGTSPRMRGKPDVTK